MPDFTQSTIADASGNASIAVGHIPSGVVWVVWQVAVETSPARPGCTATITKNLRYLSSTNLGSGASAQGPPAISLKGGDSLAVNWAGMQPGDTAIVSVYYNETLWSDAMQSGVV